MSKAAAAGTAQADELDDENPAALEDPDLEGGDGEDDESEADDDDESGDSEGGTTDEASTQDEGEQQITFGDEPEASDVKTTDAAWVNDLRKVNRQLVKERDEARAEAQRGKTPAAGKGPKPVLEDFGFDEAKYDEAMRKWLRHDLDAEIAEQRRNDAQKEAQASWQKFVGSVDAAVADLKVSRADEAKQAFEDELEPGQQAIVLHGPADPKTAAMLRHALGANPKVLRQVAAIKDPVKFAFAVADLVPKMKTTTAAKRVAPAPERVVTGSASVAKGSVAKRLDALRVEAGKTGDLSKVQEFKRKLKAQGKKV